MVFSEVLEQREEIARSASGRDDIRVTGGAAPRSGEAAGAGRRWASAVTVSEQAAGWQSRAVARSLERARAAAEARSASIVRAAIALVNESEAGDFTIQGVVDRLRISTRTFYQHFSSKDDVMVAMFEEVQREGVRALHAAVEVEDEPLARLRAFVVVRQEMVPRSPLTRLLVHHHFRLQESHPEDFRNAMEPVTTYLRALVAAVAEAGVVVVRDVDKTTALILQMVTTAIQSDVLGSSPAGQPSTPEEIWEFCLHGIGGPAGKGE